MRHWFKRVLSAIAFLGAMSSQVASQNLATRGTYVEGAGGWNQLSTTFGSHVRRPDHPLWPNEELPGVGEWEDGFGIAARLGYSWNSGFRIDGEFSYRRNENDYIEFLVNNGVDYFKVRDDDVRGHSRTIALMANAYYDILNSTGITPYVGGGIGAAYAGQDFTTSFYELTGQADRLDDHDWGFAAQAIAGVSIELSSRLSLVADFRYFKTFDISISTEQPAGSINPTLTTARVNSAGDVEHQSVMVGLRYTFGGVDAGRP